MPGRRRTRQSRLRLPQFRAPDPLEPGRHTAKRQAAARAAVSVPEPPTARAPIRTKGRPGVRVTALSDRPTRRPRDRFAGAEPEARVAAGKYERAHRAELRAQQASGGGKVSAHTRGAPTRTRGDTPARSRFAGPASSDELNRGAKQLHPTATTARGTARRPPAELRDPHATPGTKRGRHTRPLPQPELTGAVHAGQQYAPRAGGAPRHWFFGGSIGRPPQ